MPSAKAGNEASWRSVGQSSSGLGGRIPGRSRDRARLAASLEEFVGHPAYGIQQLHDDLERFIFLLGGSDGEPLSGPPRLT